MSKQTAFYVSSLLAIGTLLLYWPAGHYDFVLADDYQYICHNPPVLKGLSWDGIRWAFWSMYASNWHPLTWISHMLDCSLYGLYPGGHHLTNIFLHTANAVLLFRWLGRLTGKLWPSAFVAALFAWHPLHVESVAWICERKDVLSTFFLLLTLHAYTRYVAKPTRGRLFLTLLLFVLGLMAKPMLVTLPCLLLLLDYWPLNRFLTAAGQFKPREEWMPVLVEKIPFFFLSFCGCLLTMAAQSASGAVKETSEMPVLVRAVNALSSFGRYLGKAFWPDHLLIFYPMPTADTVGAVRGVFGGAFRCDGAGALVASKISLAHCGLVLVSGDAGAGDRTGAGRRPGDGGSLYIHSLHWTFYRGGLGIGFALCKNFPLSTEAPPLPVPLPHFVAERGTAARMASGCQCAAGCGGAGGVRCSHA